MHLTWYSTPLVETEIFIDHMQDIAFPLASTLVPWQQEVIWFQTMLNWFSPEKLVCIGSIACKTIHYMCMYDGWVT
jgi:hypothetical protein